MFVMNLLCNDFMTKKNVIVNIVFRYDNKLKNEIIFFSKIFNKKRCHIVEIDSFFFIFFDIDDEQLSNDTNENVSKLRAKKNSKRKVKKKKEFEFDYRQTEKNNEIS